MTHIKQTKQLSGVVICILTLISVSFLFVPKASAENVIIYDDKNPQLTFLKLNGNCASEQWDSSGTYEEPSKGNYTIHTNSFTAWFQEDRADMAYKKYAFKYGKKANLTLTGTLNSWDGKKNTAFAGIMLRSGTAPGAATVFFHYRPDGILLIVRSYDNVAFNTNYAGISVAQFKPVEFKLTLNQTTVKAQYRYVGGSGWSDVGSVKFDCSGTGEVLAGFMAHSADQSQMATASFSNYEVVIDAPEGTQYDDGGSTNNTTVPTEEVVTLPNDLPVQPNVLMRETFTDGNMLAGVKSITNPIWTMEGTPDIRTTDDMMNRYLYLFYDSNYYYTGDQNWTDYSLTMDVRFTEETTAADLNELTVMVRFSDTEQYGYSYYGIHFYGNNSVYIGHTRGKLLNVIKSVDVTAPLNYLADHGTHKLKIDAMDNIITVYWDDNKIVSYTDNSYNDVKLKGSIGFYAKNAAVELDNVTVVKLDDPLGGDYDNKIGGRFNEPIPDYLKPYIDNKWAY